MACPFSRTLSRAVVNKCCLDLFFQPHLFEEDIEENREVIHAPDGRGRSRVSCTSSISCSFVSNWTANRWPGVASGVAYLFYIHTMLLHPSLMFSGFILNPVVVSAMVSLPLTGLGPQKTSKDWILTSRAISPRAISDPSWVWNSPFSSFYPRTSCFVREWQLSSSFSLAYATSIYVPNSMFAYSPQFQRIYPL